MRHRQRGLGRSRLADPAARTRYLRLWLRSTIWLGLSLVLGYALIQFVNPAFGLVVFFGLAFVGLRYRWRADLIVWPQWRGRHRNRQS